MKLIDPATGLPYRAGSDGLTNAQLTAVSGTAATAAWGGTGNGTEIAILKAIYAQNVTIIGHLATIATNTAPAP